MSEVCLIDPDNRWHCDLKQTLQHTLPDIHIHAVQDDDVTGVLQHADLIICARQSTHLMYTDVLAYLDLQDTPPPLIVIGEADDDERHIVAALRAGAVDYVRLPHLHHLPDIIRATLNTATTSKAHPQTLTWNHALDIAPVVSWQISLDGVISGVRGGGVQTYDERGSAQLNGQSLAAVFDNNEQAEIFLKRLHRGEDFVQRLHGPLSHWDAYCHPVCNHQGEVLYGHVISIDVTRDTFMVDEMMSSDERFTHLFRMLPDACVILSIDDGQVLAANTRFLTLIGKPDALLTGQDIREVSGRADRAFWLNILEAGTVQAVEAQLHPATGHMVEVLVSAIPLDMIGKPSILVTLVEMTQANEQKAQLARSEHKLRTIIDEISDIILIIDLETHHINGVNPALYHLTGWYDKDLLNQPITGLFVDPNQATRIMAELDAYDAAFETVLLHCGDDRHLTADMNATVINWDGKRAVLMTLRDVSEREMTMRALHEAEERLRTVINHLPVMLNTVDQRGIFTLSAGSGLETIGLRAGEATGKSAFDVYANYPALIDDIQRVLKGERFRSQHSINGRMLETQYKPLYDRQNQLTGAISVTMDITARMEAEHAKLEINQERERMAFRQGFASMTTHEFRTPMSVIMTSVDIIRRKILDNDVAGWTDRLNIIRAQIYFMTHLLDNILLISSGQSGMMEFYPEVMNFNDLCISIARDLGLQDTEKHIYINAVDPTLDALYLDPALMRHVLTNLLQNAIKYTPAGGEIRFKAQRNQNNLIIVVADTGIGIPPADQKHLFEIFSRASNTGKIQGTGLGLALVKYCLDAHNGTIDVQSEVNVGTTFTVCIPLTEPPH